MESVLSGIGQMRRRLRAQLAKRTPDENAFLFLLPVVGVLVGLITAGTAHVIAYVQNQLWGDGHNLLTAALDNPWPSRIIIPLAGGLIVGAIGWAFKVETRGGGITTIIQGLALKGGVISLRQVWPRDWAAVFTIASGGSLGREGAMAMLASAVGSKIGRRFNLSTQHLRMLVCAAAAAALAAVYNAPIGGALFALEVLMGSFALDVLGPVVVVSVISTLVFRSCMGSLPRFEVPHYALVSGWELCFYLVLGVLAGLMSILFVRSLFGAQDLFEKLQVPRWLKPAIGLALVGVIGCFWPHVFGNGFEPVNMILHEAPEMTLKLMAILLVMKLLASSLSFGAGGAGGLFTPSLMIGALLGGVFGYGVHRMFPHISAEYGAYALVGMGGLLAGTIHAPLTAIMMIFEQTNSYQIVLPLMFVCVISHVTVRLLHGRSLDEESLKRRGIVLPRGPEAAVMQTLRVADAMHEDVHAVPANAPFRMVVESFLRLHYQNVYVVDDQGQFLGAVSLHGLKDMLHQTEELKSVIAYDLIDEQFEFVTPEEKLGDTMEKFWRQNSERLPVLEDAASRKLIGWISKRDLLGIYNQEILNKPQLLAKFTVPEEDGERAAYVPLPTGFQVRTLILPEHLAGRTLAELAPRSTYGVHILQVTHYDTTSGRETIELPGPTSRLAANDRLIVIGKADGIAKLQEALAPQVEKPTV